MMGIFISYRRADTAGYAGRLYDDLSQHFGAESVFRDVDVLQPGVDFADAISQTLNTCRVLLALIGPAWLTSTSDGQRRLDDPGDLMRVEIATALCRTVEVIPVLVQGATMPRPRDLPKILRGLTRRNAIELSDSRWRFDTDALIAAIERLGGTLPPSVPTRRQTQRDDAAGPTLGDASIRGVSVLDGASVQSSQQTIHVGHVFKPLDE
jgi:hypothetical protein